MREQSCPWGAAILVSLALWCVIILGIHAAFGQAVVVAPSTAIVTGTASNPLITAPLQGAAAYRGGTIVVGGTSQTLMAANPDRHGWNFQDQSTSFCYIKIGGSAAANNTSLRISPGGFYETPPSHVSTGAINVTCDLTNAAFYATEW